MKLRSLILAALLLTGLSAFGQIVLVGGCAAVATSCTPATVGGHSFATGQFEYTFAYKSSVTAPTLATSYTTLDTASASSSSFRSGCAVLTSSTPFNTAWTGATAVVTLIYSGEAATTTANCVTNGVGGKTTTSGTTSTYTFTTVTLTHQNASSWVIAAVGSSAAACTPSTVLTAEESSTNIIGHDTNGAVSSFSTLTCTGTAGNWKSDTVELLAAAVANPTVDTNGGTFGTSASTTLSDASGGATICYTVDGTTPASTTSGTCSVGSTYSGALTITVNGTVVKALGTKSGLSNSAVTTSNTFLINQFFPDLPLLGVSGGTLAVPAVAQVIGCSGTSTPVTCNLGSGMSAGNMAVVIAVANNGTSVYCTSVTSTPSNVFIPWIAVPTASSNRQSVFVARNVAAGTNAFVATCTGATSFVSEMVYEVANATAADVAGYAIGSGGTPSATTLQPVGYSTEEVIASIFDNSNFRTWVAGSGYSIQAEVNNSGATWLGASEDNKTKSGLSGTQTATITGVSTDAWSMSIITAVNAPSAQDSADVNVDFEGLANGVKPTVAALQSSTHGVPLTWSVGASTVFTGDTGSQGSAFPAFHAMGATNWTGNGSLGLAYATGTVAHDLTASWPITSTHISWIGQFQTSLPQNDTNLNAYSMNTLHDLTNADYAIPQIQANGTKLVLAFECKTGAGSGSVDIATNTIYYVSVDAPGNAGTGTMRVYDSSGTEKSGSPVTCTEEAGATAWSTLDFGISGAEPESVGHAISWDNIRISLTGAPLMP